MWLFVGDLFFAHNCPKRVKNVPQTILDAVPSKSSFMTFLMDNKTSGRFSKYVLESSLAVNAVDCENFQLSHWHKDDMLLLCA